MSGGYDLILWALLLIASATDLIWGKIFNAVTFSFLVAGLAWRFLALGTTSGLEGVWAVTTALVLFFPLWRLKALSAGDVKLLMAAGAWGNYKLVIQLGAIAILIGSLVGLGVLLRTEGWRAGLKSIFSHLVRTQAKKSHRIPFAPAFLCAFVLMRIAEMNQWTLIW